MFPHLHTPDFVRAVTNVRDKGFPVDEIRARSIINKMYELKGRGKFGSRFKKCRNIALTEHDITDLLTWGAYKTIVFGYFHPRAMREKQRQMQSTLSTKVPRVSQEQCDKQKSASVRLPKVTGKPNANEVEFDVYPWLSVVIRARKAYGPLKTFKDVSIVSTTIFSGSSDWIDSNRWVTIHKKALATMKDHRHREAVKVA